MVWALCAPKQAAEAARRRLKELGWLDGGRRTARAGGLVCFPLSDAGVRALAPGGMGDGRRVGIGAGFPNGCTLADVDLPPTPQRYRTHLELLRLSGSAAPVPRALDIVGRVAILKAFAGLEGMEREVGEAVLAAHPSIRTVAVDDGVTGPMRLRGLRVIAGDPSLETEHRENGVRLRVDLAKVYFSPRLATERSRVASQVGQGERVLDMFAGVGPFAVLIAKQPGAAEVVAVDVNPDAVRYLEENARINRVSTLRALLGDARDVVPDLGGFHRVIMNLPHGAEAFLDLARGALLPGGTIHLYLIGTEKEHQAFLGRTEGRWTVAYQGRVRGYAPGVDHRAYDLRMVL